MLKYLFRILKKIPFYIRRKKNLITLNKVKVSPKIRSLQNMHIKHVVN